MKFFGVFLVVVICNWSNDTVKGRESNSKIFTKPCFDGDEIENMCADPSDSCHEKSATELKLVRLDGVKVIPFFVGSEKMKQL